MADEYTPEQRAWLRARWARLAARAFARPLDRDVMLGTGHVTIAQPLPPSQRPVPVPPQGRVL